MTKKQRRPQLAVNTLEDRAVPASFSGGIHTSTVDGTAVDANIYADKRDVYLNGGPQNTNGSGLPDGIYVFQVTNPSGSRLLSTDPYTAREVQVQNGRVFGTPGTTLTITNNGPTTTATVDGGLNAAYYHKDGTYDAANQSIPVQLLPYDDTNNNGGEYKAWLTPLSSYDTDPTHFDAKHYWGFDGPTKTDNFKVNPQGGDNGGAGTVVLTTTSKVGSSTGDPNNPAAVPLDDNGQPVLLDTALLSGTTATDDLPPTGTITFTLYGPDSSPIWSEEVPVNGFNSYPTQTGYTLPADGSTVVGEYQWEASFDPDTADYFATDDQGGSQEAIVVNPASPQIETTPGSVIQIGHELTDTATLTGGYYETGTITFNLYAPGVDPTTGGLPVYTATVPVHGNGDYNTGAAVATTGSDIATVGGTYEWVATYNGDGNNNAVSGKLDDEPEVVLSTGFGLTLGYYSNKNGEALLTGSASGSTVYPCVINFLKGAGNDTANNASTINLSYAGSDQAYTGLDSNGKPVYTCLVGANGAYVKWCDLAKYSNLAALLKNATATNMANMLSAQMLTTALNCYYVAKAGAGSSSGTGITASETVDVSKVTALGSGGLSSAQIDAGLQAGGTSVSGITMGTESNSSDDYTTIQTLFDKAVAELSSSAGKNTTASGADRTFEESLKDCFDGINNREDVLYIPTT